jgi:hypothetical protein
MMDILVALPILILRSGSGHTETFRACRIQLFPGPNRILDRDLFDTKKTVRFKHFPNTCCSLTIYLPGNFLTINQVLGLGSDQETGSGTHRRTFFLCCGTGTGTVTFLS